MPSSKFIQYVDFGGPASATSFDVPAFEAAIAKQGVVFAHAAAMRCPVGLVDLHDGRRPGCDHSGCRDGYHFRRKGDLTVLFTGNPLSKDREDVSFLDGSTAQMTSQRYYEGDDSRKFPVVAVFDRLYLLDDQIVVPHWQLFVSSPSGLDRLEFPVAEVDGTIMDSDGAEYAEGDDFEITKRGDVEWIGARRPRIDPELGTGQVCSIRFNYRPYFVVSRMNHQIRVAQVDDPANTGKRIVVRMPQSFTATREYIRLAADRDDQQPAATQREQAPGPADGSFPSK